MTLVSTFFALSFCSFVLSFFFPFSSSCSLSLCDLCVFCVRLCCVMCSKWNEKCSLLLHGQHYYQRGLNDTRHKLIDIKYLNENRFVYGNIVYSLVRPVVRLDRRSVGWLVGRLFSCTQTRTRARSRSLNFECECVCMYALFVLMCI